MHRWGQTINTIILKSCDSLSGASSPLTDETHYGALRLVRTTTFITKFFTHYYRFFPAHIQGIFPAALFVISEIWSAETKDDHALREYEESPKNITNSVSPFLGTRFLYGGVCTTQYTPPYQRPGCTKHYTFSIILRTITLIRALYVKLKHSNQNNPWNAKRYSPAFY